MSDQNTPKKILVIDDDPVHIKLTGTVLTSKGFEVLTSNEAPAGLDKALTQKPDLIILDVMMPIVNGYNFCRLLKTQDDQKNIPVILLTSRASDKDKQIGEEVGANAYLTKPFKTEDLLNTINQLLNAC